MSLIGDLDQGNGSCIMHTSRQNHLKKWPTLDRAMFTSFSFLSSSSSYFFVMVKNLFQTKEYKNQSYHKAWKLTRKSHLCI